jgi:tetratricopeptide (TPR) repeat protein/signal transduction histidine kinase
MRDRSRRPWRLACGLCCGLWLAIAAAAPKTEIERLNEEARALLRSDPQRSQQIAQRALELSQAQQDHVGEARARINLGSIERQRGRYDQAVVEFERAVALAREQPNSKLYAQSLAQLGVTLDIGGLHAEALETQSAALAIYEQADDAANASAVLINLGNTLDNLGDPQRSREHYQRALEVKRSHGISKGIGSVLNNLADLALESGTIEQAIDLFDQAIVAHEADGDRIGLGLALRNRGIAHARAGRFDAALSDIQRGEAITRELEHALGIAAALRARAEVWLQRSRSLEGDARDYALLSAEREARAAVVASSENDDPERRAAAQRVLAEVLAARGDASGAIALLDEIERAAESERARRDDARVAMVRARYESQQAETEMALLREREAAQSAELARSRLLLRSALGIGIAAVTAMVLLFWVARERRLRAETLREQGEALREALARAEANGERARAVAELNQRLLELAGDDLQAPLAEIRGSAERLLAANHANPALSRPMAAIARHASDLMQIVLRMRESAQLHEQAAVQPQLDLSELLEHCATQAEPRTHQRQQLLRSEIAPGLRVFGTLDTLSHLCSELLDHCIRLNPPGSRLELVLRAEAEHAVLTLSDHDGALRELLLDAQRNSGGGSRELQARRLGLGLLRESVLRSGGSIDSIAATAPATGQLLRVLLPLAS